MPTYLTALPKNPLVVPKLIKDDSVQLLWKDMIRPQYKILMYTIWIKKDGFSSKMINCTTTQYTVRLWGVGWYEIGVTAWNGWGESKLESNKTIMISVNASTVYITKGTDANMTGY